MTTIKLWSDYFFPLYPLVGFDEAVRIAEEHVPTTGTAPEQHSLPRAAHSPDGLCEGVDSTRPDTASAQADRGGGSTEGRADHVSVVHCGKGPDRGTAIAGFEPGPPPR